MTTLTITPEFSTDELQDLIDGLPPYWTTHWFDEDNSCPDVNEDNLILIDWDENTEYQDWTKYYINWIDGSYWTFTYCCELFDGPFIHGPETPPIHTCEEPPKDFAGWNSLPLISDEDIPF